MESALVSGVGEWYYILLVAVFSTFFGLLSFKLGDTLAAIREIAINTRTPEEKDEEVPVDYEEKYPRMLNVKGFVFSTKGMFSILGVAFIIVGWIPILVKIKESIGME
ncbi:MAG: hypothetical protein GY757_41955 [bacterium]|nr:hypothetical protein [bacterium]